MNVLSWMAVVALCVILSVVGFNSGRELHKFINTQSIQSDVRDVEKGSVYVCNDADEDIRKVWNKDCRDAGGRYGKCGRDSVKLFCGRVYSYD